MTAPSQILLETPRFRVERREQRLSDGRSVAREVIVHPGAVTVVPVLDDGQVCLIRNYRVAVDETLIELPAGTLDSGEDPAVAAGRELTEETGYRARTMEPLCQFFMSPGILNERMFIFVGSGLEAGPTALEPGEQIETLIVPLEEALQMVFTGQIHDAKTVAALLFFERFGSS